MARLPAAAALVLCSSGGASAARAACSVAAAGYPYDSWPQDNCTSGSRCCPDNAWDFASNFTRWAGHCFVAAAEVCTTPVPHCSVCVSVPCVDICTRPAHVSCRGVCMDPATQVCCGGVVCDPAEKGEACSRDNFCDGGRCCARGTTPCESTTYGGSGSCCTASQVCNTTRGECEVPGQPVPSPAPTPAPTPHPPTPAPPEGIARWRIGAEGDNCTTGGPHTTALNCVRTLWGVGNYMLLEGCVPGGGGSVKVSFHDDARCSYQAYTFKVSVGDCLADMSPCPGVTGACQVAMLGCTLTGEA